MTQLLIEAGRTERQYWRDLWRYRELFYFLAWRDLLVRYKQTFVGVGWSLIRPLLTMTCAYGGVWKAGQNAFRRAAVSAIGFLRNAALAIFFHRDD